MQQCKGITIHNTGNTMSAKENYDYLAKNDSLYLCHYLVDEKRTINTWPEEEPSYHTGKGYDYGNLYTISVEICRSPCEEALYLKAEKRAISLIKKLMKKYGLTTNDIYFHKDFNKRANCPHRIFEIYKTKQKFIERWF